MLDLVPDPLGRGQRGWVVVLPALGRGVNRGDVFGLRLVPPLVLLNRGECALHGCTLGSFTRLGFVCRLGVLLLALAQRFLAHPGQGFGQP